jgi:hypothetical protein
MPKILGLPPAPSLPAAQKNTWLPIATRLSPQPMVPLPVARYDVFVAGLDEASARGALAAMQDRLVRDPASALGIGARATPQDVRAAFLSLTKLFHPVRFGRMASDIQKLSNEVFLGLRAAHDALLKAARSHTGPLSVASARGAAAGPTPPHGSAPIATPPGPPPAAAPVGVRNGGRAQLPPQTSGAPPANRPGLRPIGAPPGAPAATALPGNPGRQSGASPIAQHTEATAIELLARQQWEQARTILHQLRAKEPGSKRIPALMAYARGREAQLDGRIDDARVELGDALDLDPTLQLAKDAQAELFRRRK